MKSKLTFIHALSPLHAGTGQGVGVIDLPIAREKATNIPYLPGSSVKGSLRDEFNEEEDIRNKIFGPESKDITDNNGYAGAIQFTDQTLLCLPVRSLAGTFAYVTSPYILKRLKRDANLSEDKCNLSSISDDKCRITADSALKLTDTKLCLEDLDLEFEANEAVWAAWLKDKIFADTTWRDLFVERFCIVSDNVFGFLLNTATEVTARIKIQNDTKTTEKGALWYEESLPTESILFGLALAFPNKETKKSDGNVFTPKEIFDAIEAKLDKPLQFGGNATVGRGICQVRLAEIVENVASASGGN